MLRPQVRFAPGPQSAGSGKLAPGAIRMSLSDKLRAGLGAQGTRVEVSNTDGVGRRGTTIPLTVTVVGGVRPAVVDALRVRLVEARRHWEERGGKTVSEEQAQALPDRTQLVPRWRRETIHERKLPMGQALSDGQRREVAVEFEIPPICAATTVGCTHLLHVVAEVKGQIDPSCNLKLRIA